MHQHLSLIHLRIHDISYKYAPTSVIPSVPINYQLNNREIIMNGHFS